MGSGQARADRPRGRWLAGAPRSPAGRPLRVAMLAPPWIPVPAPGYGGVESVVSTLTEALVRRGHAVTLFCAPGSASRAKVVTLLDEPHPDEIERSLYEVDHVGRVFDEIDVAARGEPFDVVHDHCGFAALAMANRIDTPLVHTLHGAFTADTAPFYARHGHKAALVGISRAQISSAPPGLGPIDSIPNPIDLRDWPLRERKGDYLLWIGRMTAEKGPHRSAGRTAGMRSNSLTARSPRDRSPRARSRAMSTTRNAARPAWRARYGTTNGLLRSSSGAPAICVRDSVTTSGSPSVAATRSPSTAPNAQWTA